MGPAKRLEAFGGISISRRTITIPRLAGQTVEVETPDQLLIHLDFGEARFGQLFAAFTVSRSKAPAFELHATGGSVSVSADEWYAGNGATDVFLRDETPLGAAGWMNAVPLPEYPEPENLIGAGPRHFVECLQGTAEPILTAAHACHVLEIMLAAYRSIDEGRAIELETSF
jgi:predicted dehydrogenase